MTMKREASAWPSSSAQVCSISDALSATASSSRSLTEYQLSAEITNQISLNSYMGTFLMMIFVMGLVFEIPLLAWVMSRLGLINQEFLKSYRRHAVAVLLILAAAITPTGDPFTLVVVFIPLYLLYELAIRIVRKAPEEEDENEEDIQG